MQVVILCGGLGSRLKSISGDVPKPLVDVLGKPFLLHQIDLLVSQGFTRFLLLAGYRGDIFLPVLSSSHCQIDISIEPDPMGTGGALEFAEHFLDKQFLLLNGDTYLNIFYQELVDSFEAHSAYGLISAFTQARMNLKTEPNNLRLEGEHVVAYKKGSTQSDLTHLDAGAGVFCKERLFNYFSSYKAPYSLEEDVWPLMIKDRKLMAYRISGKPYDIGTPERYKLFLEHLSRGGIKAYDHF